MAGILEICCTSLESAEIAVAGGANRIELCANLYEGGTTPSAAMIKLIKQKVDIGLYVIIRPRGGDFVYSDDEFMIMQEDISYCQEAGVDGIVCGILTADGDIDVGRTRQLVELCGEKDFTFHRAFDLVNNPAVALHEVISTGAKRILTSGLRNNVVEGNSMLQKLVELAGNDIIIMAGGGVNLDNIEELIATTGCLEFHTTAKTWINSNANHQSEVRMNGIPEIPEDKRMVTSIDIVRRMRNILDNNY